MKISVMIAATALAVIMTAMPAAGQNDSELGGDALKTLTETGDGKYSRYVNEYQRMYVMYSGDGSFEDYFSDGQKYTVFLPDNAAVEVYYRDEGNISGNPPRLRNTIKYSIAKGRFTTFKDGQKLYTLFPSHPIQVSVRKGKVWVTDLAGNKARLGEPIESGNIIFYPVKTFLRYQSR